MKYIVFIWLLGAMLVFGFLTGHAKHDPEFTIDKDTMTITLVIWPVIVGNIIYNAVNE